MIELLPPNSRFWVCSDSTFSSDLSTSWRITQFLSHCHRLTLPAFRWIHCRPYLLGHSRLTSNQLPPCVWMLGRVWFTIKTDSEWSAFSHADVILEVSWDTEHRADLHSSNKKSREENMENTESGDTVALSAIHTEGKTQREMPRSSDQYVPSTQVWELNWGHCSTTKSVKLRKSKDSDSRTPLNEEHHSYSQNQLWKSK